MRSMQPCLACLFLLAFINACQPANEVLPPPNILWIVSEDNSPFLGAYGDSFASTPTLDSLAAISVRYTHAYATTPVCAPSRSTLITGMYANSMGTLPMRSTYAIPKHMRFFPNYLREAGYYCTNNSKKDYNTIDQPAAWDESSNKASYKGRKAEQPFFHVQNLFITHESQLHDSIPWGSLRHDPTLVPLPPYHPRTKDMEHDWAQYYDRMQQMDSLVNNVVKELVKEGLHENTIVFYYSDHGGALGRSKRFLYQSGLKVPLIIYFPEKYKHLAPAAPGARADQLVNFADFGPTVLSLAGIATPEYMQGKPFLGAFKTEPRSYSPAYKGRMDERIDLVRGVTNGKFRYLRNYMPYKPNGQHIEYLWQARSMPSWEKAFIKGGLNDTQAAFWLPRPAEELYDVEIDPHNITNLATDPAFANVLAELRSENLRWLNEMRDTGFVPEPMIAEISEIQPIYDYVRGKDFQMERVIETADLASFGDPSALPELRARLDHPNAAVRYWATLGCMMLGDKTSSTKAKLIDMVADPSASVRLAVAEALFKLGEKNEALLLCREALRSKSAVTRLYAANVLEYASPDQLSGEVKTELAASLTDSTGTAMSELPKAVNHLMKKPY